MDERFTYLVEKYLDNNLDEREKAEFDKFLRDPLCSDYLEKAKKVEKFIEEGFRMRNERAAKEKKAAAAAADKKKPGYSESDDIAEEVKEDIIKYGGLKNPETVLAVKKMHRNMLNRRRDIRRLIFSSVAAAILTGIAFFFLQPSMTSPQKLSKKFYKRYEFIPYMSLLETNSNYNKALIAYKSFDYSASARVCREIIADGTPDADVHFLYGLNLMELDSTESAIQQFNATSNLLNKKEGNLYVPAHWYSGLCWLAMGKSNAALKELEMIRGVDNANINEFDVEGLVGRIRGLKRR